MKNTALVLLNLLFIASLSKAAVVTFTGGNAILVDGIENPTENPTENPNIAVTDESQRYQGVSSYQEGDVILDYISPTEDWSFQTVGNYYDDGNDVIHGHWSSLSAIEIYREDDVAFDLQFFSLTSNTEIGGGQSTGNENIAIQGFLQGEAVTQLFSLGSEDWGGEFQDVFLPAEFNNVDKVVIKDLGQWQEGTWCADCNSAFCFGMDNFVFDEVVPEEFIAGNSVQLEVTQLPEASAILFAAIPMLLLLTKKRRS